MEHNYDPDFDPTPSTSRGDLREAVTAFAFAAAMGLGSGAIVYFWMAIRCAFRGQ